MRSEVQKLPELFLERLRRIVPSQKWDAIANTFTEPKPTTFRINTLTPSPLTLSPLGGEGRAAWTSGGWPLDRAAPGGWLGVRELLQEKLEHQGFRLEKVSWYPDAFILRDGRLRDLQETEIYKTGRIYVQGLSSMVPALVLDPQSGERVLDLTAAPGSKTTQMACLMKGEGEIVANDNNRIRFFKLKANVELQGSRNVKLMMKHGELFGRDFPEGFNRILLDAPCSAEGRFQVREPASYRYWKPAKIKEMVRKQKNLILSALRALRPDGTLVYSTCTFAPEENEGVLNWLIGKVGDQIEIEKVGAWSPGATPPLQQISNHMPGLTQWEGERFHPSLRNAVRILPTPLMEGFFLARILKK